MRIIIQRVTSAGVVAAGKEISRISKGMLVFLGITLNDDLKLAEKMAKKLLRVRLWDEIVEKKKEAKGEEEEEKISNTVQEPKSWHTSLMDNSYEMLVVSQFTLYGNLKGNRPDFHLAMPSEEAKKIYDFFVDVLKKDYKEEKIKEGVFQEYMYVDLVNDGPVTMVYEEENEAVGNGNGKEKKKK